MEPQPIIWIIDSEHWPRALMRAEFIERGYDAIGFENIKDAVFALTHREIPRFLILEFHHQIIDEEDLKQIAEKGIPMVALIGSDADGARFSSAVQWASILKRPFTIGQICDAVQNLGL